jgi:hypothetical protein
LLVITVLAKAESSTTNTFIGLFTISPLRLDWFYTSRDSGEILPRSPATLNRYAYA